MAGVKRRICGNGVTKRVPAGQPGPAFGTQGPSLGSPLRAILERRALLQFCGFCFGLNQEGNVWVGVLPQVKELLVENTGAGGVALHGVGASQAETRDCSKRIILHYARV